MNFSESSKDSITTVCYGEVREWDERSEARNHFLEAMWTIVYAIFTKKAVFHLISSETLF